MKTRIFSFIIGLTLLVGTPLTTISLVNSYSSPVFQKVEVETKFETTSFINIDFPIKEGNLRLLKINFRDLRTVKSCSGNYLKKLSETSNFSQTKNNFQFRKLQISEIFALHAVPIFIEIHSLLI